MMPTSPVPSFFESFSQALLYGPEMLLFHAVFIAWLVIFFIHLGRPHRRAKTSVLLYSLAILCGMLAPFHESLRDLHLLRTHVALGGSLSPTEWLQHEQPKYRGSLIILSTAILFLALSTWAWLMPRPVRCKD